jgi:hypothetical protein
VSQKVILMSSNVIENANPVINAHDKVLSPAHHLAMSLRFQGKSYAEIGKAVNLHAGTVRNWFMVNGALHSAYTKYCANVMDASISVKEIHAPAISVGERLKQVAPIALENVIDLANNAKREQVKAQCNFDLLDRAGYKPIERTLNVHAVEEMGAEDLTKLVDGLLTHRGIHLDSKSTEVTSPISASLYNTQEPSTPSDPDPDASNPQAPSTDPSPKEPCAPSQGEGENST